MTRLATCLPSADHWTPPRPWEAAMPAPHRPPISACVELLGRPRYHVRRCHVMPPIKADITITSAGLIETALALVSEPLTRKKPTVEQPPTRLDVAATSTG